MYACLEPLLEEGVRYFGVGGALGFETLVAEKLLALRESRPEIRASSWCSLSRATKAAGHPPSRPARPQ